jgi:hypothetical protein
MLKIQRKRRSDRNHVIYYVQNVVTHEFYIGLTALCYNGNVRKTLTRRMQKHLQRALTEDKNWSLSLALEVVRGKAAAHALETQLIKEHNPALNTFK